MKKLGIVFFLAMFSIAFLPNTAKAQVNVGGGLAYGSDIESPGMGLMAEFFVKEEISIAPKMIYFFPRNLFSNYKFKWFEINTDVHYYPNFDLNLVRPYAIGGLNLAILTIPNSTVVVGNNVVVVEDNSQTELGLNIGAGTEFDVGQGFIPFGELRATIGNADQLVLFAGVKIPIGN